MGRASQTDELMRAIIRNDAGAMKLLRRQFLHLAAGAAVLPTVPRVAWAQSYPARPVRLIVPIAAGGSQDIFARLVGQWLSERLGQPFVIDNRPGGGGNIGTEAVVRAPPDGYTLLLVSGANLINAALYEKLNFNFIRDVAPIAGIIRVPHVTVVHPSVPAKTVPEFIAYAKAYPGKVNMASGGTGNATHLTGELFKMMAGVDMVHVPYRGGGPAFADLLGRQVQVFFPTMVSSIEYVRAGSLRALAVTTATRSEVLPDIPTVGEFVPGYWPACPFLIARLTLLPPQRLASLRTTGAASVAGAQAQPTPRARYPVQPGPG